MNRNLSRPSVFAPILAAAAWLAALFFIPPERTLGTLLRWVFAHASLTQVSLVLFSAAALLAVLYLLGGARLFPWMSATGGMALALWLAGFLLSTIPAKFSWGVWVDLHEPRTQMTLSVLAAGFGFAALTRWVDHRQFTAIAQIVLSLLVLFLNRSAGVIRHPLNPIGRSGDASLPFLYGVIFLLALSGSALFVLFWVTRTGRPGE